MNQANTGGLRCHDADACAFGQKPCPTPGACGCAPAPQAVQAAVPKWIDDPHDIEQGQMLNPEWVKLQQSYAPAHPAEGVPAPAAVTLPANPHPENTSRHEAWEDGFAGREMQMCAAGGAYARAYREGAAALAATQPAAQGMEKSACGYPELPAGSEACEFNSYAIVYDADEMREYVDADRRMRAALAAQAKQGGAA